MINEVSFFIRYEGVNWRDNDRVNRSLQAVLTVAAEVGWLFPFSFQFFTRLAACLRRVRRLLFAVKSSSPALRMMDSFCIIHSTLKVISQPELGARHQLTAIRDTRSFMSLRTSPFARGSKATVPSTKKW